MVHRKPVYMIHLARDVLPVKDEYEGTFYLISCKYKRYAIWSANIHFK